MTAIERTAYPQLNKNHYRKSELQHYIPSDEELEYMKCQNIRSDAMRLNFMLQLKTFQRLSYFPKIEAIPKPIVKQVRQALDSPQRLNAGYAHTSAQYQHRNSIRKYLNVNQHNNQRDRLIEKTAEETAKTMNDPADIINVVLETLMQQQYELPSFTSIDRTISRIRQAVNNNIFKTIEIF